jgi:nucleoside recognition membrane protein YjiH
MNQSDRTITLVQTRALAIICVIMGAFSGGIMGAGIASLFWWLG